MNDFLWGRYWFATSRWEFKVAYLKKKKKPKEASFSQQFTNRSPKLL